MGAPMPWYRMKKWPVARGSPGREPRTGPTAAYRGCSVALQGAGRGGFATPGANVRDAASAGSKTSLPAVLAHQVRPTEYWA
jgi:hypothetical protein